MRFIVFRFVFTLIFAPYLTYRLIPIMRRVATKWGIVDHPDGKLKRHEKPTPYLGGLVVYLPFITTLALIYPFGGQTQWLVFGITILLFVGLIDDVVPFTALQKFAGQGVAVLCFLKGGLSLKAEFFSSLVTIPVTGLWMLTVINAFNLVDVMDGLASTLALMGAGALFILALLQGNTEIALLLFAFMCPLVVFLAVAGKPKATMYLGDAGALWIGGFLSAMPLFFSWREGATYGFVAPALFVALPLLEVGSLILQRIWHGIPFWQGSPHHLAIILQGKGWSPRSILLLAVMSSGALSTITLAYVTGLLPLFLLQCSFLCFLLFWSYLIFLF